MFHKQVCDKEPRGFISQKCVSCAAFSLLDMSGGKTLAATSSQFLGLVQDRFQGEISSKYGNGLHIFIVIFYAVRI